jgi:hypothetical protein
MATNATATIPDFSAHAAESYSRLVAHTQQLLARIYRGELSPALLQQQMPTLVQQRGAEYYRELNRLSYELFTGLLDLGRTYREELFRALLPASPDFRPPPRPAASYRVDDWAHWHEAFKNRVVDEHNEASAQYQVLLRKIAAGEITAEAMQEHLRRFVDQRTPDYARQAAELNTMFFDGLITLNQRSVDDLFKQLMSTGVSSAREAETLSLSLVGSSGTIVTGSLTVENLLAHRSQVSCSISEFRRTDGTGPAFLAACEAEPAEFWLDPNETRVITVRLLLKPDVFPIGHNFAATMLIHGGGEEDILVFILAGATVV